MSKSGITREKMGKTSAFPLSGRGSGGGGGNFHMKGDKMPIVSLWGVNFEFWSHYGVLGKTQ